jgi:plastocyanin
VISISRIFLSAHDNAAVVAGTVITIAIMVGAAVLSYSSRMRASSRGLVMVIFLLGILGGGIVVVGASEEHDEGGGTLPPDTPANYGLQFESTSDLRFVPDAAEGQTGLAKITMTNRGGEHTFTFDDAATQFDSLLVSNVGQTDEAVAYFGEPGEYTFYCATPGHRAAGMEGVITVAGDPISLAEAEASAGGGGGEGGGSTETSAP